MRMRQMKKKNLQSLAEAPNHRRLSRSFLNSSDYGNGKPIRRQSTNGQIVVEYVLLLVVAVSLAILITKVVINRSADNPGFVINAWEAMIQQIGAEKPDDISRKK
jgi:hypothetical protein